MLRRLVQMTLKPRVYLLPGVERAIEQFIQKHGERNIKNSFFLLLAFAIVALGIKSMPEVEIDNSQVLYDKTLNFTTWEYHKVIDDIGDEVDELKSPYLKLVKSPEGFDTYLNAQIRFQCIGSEEIAGFVDFSRPTDFVVTANQQGVKLYTTKMVFGDGGEDLVILMDYDESVLEFMDSEDMVLNLSDQSQYVDFVFGYRTKFAYQLRLDTSMMIDGLMSFLQDCREQ